jgi:hypothetical protein
VLLLQPPRRFSSVLSRNGTPVPKPVSPAQRRQFYALLASGLNPAEAARQCGLSRQTGWRLSRGVEGSRSMVEMDRREEAMPDPKSWDALDGGVRDTLLDFNLFAEVFLLRRPLAWRRDAANRVVEALQDRTSRSYMVLSQPPGSGKSTLYTHDIPVWLLCGGGLRDPLRGRAKRIMLGSFGYRSATHYVQRIQRLLESPRPFYDKAAQAGPGRALARSSVRPIQATAAERRVESG